MKIRDQYADWLRDAMSARLGEQFSDLQIERRPRFANVTFSFACGVQVTATVSSGLMDRESAVDCARMVVELYLAERN